MAAAAAAVATPMYHRALDFPIISTLQHWLVEHPTIYNFEWNPGHTVASTPRFVALTIASYLFFTFFLSNEMSRRPPLPRPLVKSMCILYNIAIITLSIIMATGCALSVLTISPTIQSAVCFPKGTAASGPAFFWGYVFYLSKIVEYTDTLLIILSSSTKRLSFLHIYHHSMSITMCYLVLHTAQSSFPMILITNCSVHVLMYTYYLLTAVGIRPTWKRMVTDCQLLQFWSSFAILTLLVYFHFTGSGCSGMLSWCFNMFFIISLLFLFTDFHTKSYAASSAEKTKKV